MFPYRDLNQSNKTPYVTYGLILINVCVFAYMLSNPDSGFIQEWGVRPSQILSGENLSTLVTSMFIHSGWMHIMGNMLFLYVFGDNIESRLGPIRFILFYLIGGLAAFGAQALTDVDSSIPMVGASGAIGAVLGGYLVFFPHSAIQAIFLLGGPGTVSARYLITIWFVFQVLYGVPNLVGQGGGVAYFAHIGGFAAGWLMAKAFDEFFGGDNTNTQYR